MAPESLLLNRRVLKIGLVLSLVFSLIAYLLWLLRPSGALFADFYGLWSAGRFAATSGSAVYDRAQLQAFQRAADPGFPYEFYYPCPYPPSFLLILAPIGLLPLGLAYTVWMVVTFGGYLRATLGRAWLSWSGAALLAAPTTYLAASAGQNGFLTAALLVGGLRCLASAPIAGGVLLGLLSYKAQFGLLVPIALLAARQGRAILAAGLTIVACIAVSATLFGPSVWSAWFESLPRYGALLADNRPGFLHLMPTIAASIELTTRSVLLANFIQAAATLAIAILIWRCFAAGLERGIAPLLIGTVLATPYGFIYDLPMTASAVVLEWHWRRRNGVSFQAWEIALIVAFFEGATIMSAYSIPFVVPTLLIALLASFLRVRRAT